VSRKQKNEDGANGTAAAATHRIVLIKHAEYGVVVMIPDPHWPKPTFTNGSNLMTPANRAFIGTN
jgi:hypothetical protein